MRSKKPGFFDRIHVYYGPEWDQDKKEETELEIHADGVKEVPKCPSCEEPCGNEWCCMNEEKQ